MKYIFLLFYFVSSQASSYELQKSVLTPEEVLEIAEEYLLEERGMPAEKYYLENLRYQYYSNISKEKKEEYGEWSLFYITYVIENGRKIVPFGGHFNLDISNHKKPKIKFVGGA